MVATSIAQSLGVIESGNRPLLDDLKSHLRGKSLLLILDNFEQVTDAGVIRFESKDFIIDAADYTLASVVVEPQLGDRITDHLSNVFEVLGDNGLPCFKYTDGYRTQLRIHTKQVG